MNIEELRDYCISKPAVSESFPFDESTLVFKVAGKMFLLTDLVGPLSMNIKNTPEKVLEIRELHPCVLPGYHMNKIHWITVMIDGSLADDLLKQWIDESYNLIVAGFSRKEKDLYAALLQAE
ncbi:MAG TPA: MmcQ/YjbR family DNA-binding protein [Bacteroidales bacterium]|nr:MmcQ/YjbR family DNA-binding protein [Bacteroidales bacterium]